jgi:hypothetical protein
LRLKYTGKAVESREIVGGERNSLAIVAWTERFIRKLDEEQRKRQGGFKYWIPHRKNVKTQNNKE